MNSRFIEYVVSERPLFPNTLRIDSERSAQLLQRFSGAVNGNGEIGSYELKLSPADFGELRRLTTDESFRRAVDGTGKILPGASHRIVRVYEETATIEKAAQWDGTQDPAVTHVFAALDRAIEQLRRAPKRVLRVHLAEVLVDPQGTVTAALTLHNPGSERVMVRSLLTMNRSSGEGLEIEAWPDRPGVRAEDVIRAEGTIEKQPQDAGGVIDLQPGQSLVYRVHATLKWKTQEPHQVRLRYDGPTTGLVEGELSGESYTPMVRASVR